ncbi:hypothetical protein HYFRA_00001902 [Hymenoscyphus fraxineus]|uniref:Ketoreductase domain-containing protein n=1 Tax=Hymenoscyphus fraxineus TaxID=746836 RepID=A0A9N9KMP1_9HELO|nr:hypothetical protein HYFRA_00001902 [Hymenoscyphus fraxineus]
MSLPFEGKTALITGGSKGIGLAISHHLSSLGAKVIINYASSSSAADAAVSSIGPDKALAIQADVSSMSDLDRLVKESLAWSGGKIDILVNCAAILKPAELEGVTEADYDQVFGLNVKGVVFLTQKITPHMPPNSRIILFSTTQAHASTVTAPYLIYTMTKGAIEQMTRVLSKDLARKGITVNCIAPGPTGTDMFFAGKSESLLKMLASLNPQNRIGEPSEIASVVGFLCGEGARWVTGQTLNVNGGMA